MFKSSLPAFNGRKKCTLNECAERFLCGNTGLWLHFNKHETGCVTGDNNADWDEGLQRWQSAGQNHCEMLNPALSTTKLHCMWEYSPCYPTGREVQSRDDATLQLCAWRGSLESPVMYTQLHSLLTFWSSYDFIILSTVWGHFQSLAYKLILFESMCIQSATTAHFQENMQFWLKDCMSLFPILKCWNIP